MASPDRPRVPLRVQDHLNHWAEAIKAHRIRQRLTLAEFARMLQVSRPTVQRVEAGDPGVAAAVYVNALMSLGLGPLAIPDLDPVYREVPERKRVRHTREEAGMAGHGHDDF